MRVLVIEDTVRIADAIKQGLAQEGYAVDVEYDGEAGLMAGLHQPYDIIILDIMLPSIDGFQVCRKLRESGVTTPVLMLTARTQDQDIIEGLDVGADDYLGKPFSFDVLIARIRALLRRPARLTDDDITVGDLMLSVVNHTVIRSAQTVALSKKEFAILEYLMRHAGEACSKQSIIEHVWDFDADILPNTLEVFITYLRAKIDKPFSSPVIRTIRGFGYKVEQSS